MLTHDDLEHVRAVMREELTTQRQASEEAHVAMFNRFIYSLMRIEENDAEPAAQAIARQALGGKGQG